MKPLTEADDGLPEAMVLYLASRLTKVSKHSPGHAGQKYRARARRRGTWGKACRRRALARQRLALTSRADCAGLALRATAYDEILAELTAYDELVGQ